MFKAITSKFRAAQAQTPEPAPTPAAGVVEDGDLDALATIIASIQARDLVGARGVLDNMRSNIEATKQKDPAFAAIAETAIANVAAALDAAQEAEKRANQAEQP